jgi:hypothetical protein
MLFLWPTSLWPTSSSWRICEFTGLRAHRVLGVDVILQDYSLVENDTRSHQLMPWFKAFRIFDGEYSKTRLNVFEPGCARTMATWYLFIWAPQWFTSNELLLSLYFSTFSLLASFDSFTTSSKKSIRFLSCRIKAGRIKQILLREKLTGVAIDVVNSYGTFISKMNIRSMEGLGLVMTSPCNTHIHTLIRSLSG